MCLQEDSQIPGQLPSKKDHLNLKLDSVAKIIELNELYDSKFDLNIFACGKLNSIYINGKSYIYHSLKNFSIRIEGEVCLEFKTVLNEYQSYILRPLGTEDTIVGDIFGFDFSKGVFNECSCQIPIDVLININNVYTFGLNVKESITNQDKLKWWYPPEIYGNIGQLNVNVQTNEVIIIDFDNDSFISLNSQGNEIFIEFVHDKSVMGHIDLRNEFLDYLLTKKSNL